MGGVLESANRIGVSPNEIPAHEECGADTVVGEKSEDSGESFVVVHEIEHQGHPAGAPGAVVEYAGIEGRMQHGIPGFG